MTMLESFVKERNEALFSLDRKKIEAYLNVPESKNENNRVRMSSFWLNNDRDEETALR